ncbi:MAG: regulatory protein [Bacteroidetes bacterium]|nr:MAG: regulatory protein [Bacteroidota bacterium]
MEEQKKKMKITDPALALVKAEAWCALQERCQQEVRDKLYGWGLWPDAVENIIAELISRNFLDEERFAKAYAGGKFRQKHWGRVKIKLELKKRKVSDYCIRKGLAEIDGKDYLATLRKLAAEKSRTIKEKHYLKKKYKIMTYLAGKGYEQDLVREIMCGDED